SFAPRGNVPVDAIRTYVGRARVLAALAGTLAALCVAAVAVRITGRLLAGVVSLAALLVPGWTSARAIFDFRSEPFTLLLFWLGVLLVTSRKTVLAGIGIGLVAAAGVWNPKWPAESLVILVLFGYRMRRSALA